MKNTQKKGTFIVSGRRLWPHEMRAAEILTMAGHDIKFLEESNLHTADILLDGIEFEIKSPKSAMINFHREI